MIRRRPALGRMLLAAFVSTCGDRLHQVALAALVLGVTDSLASAGLVFVVSTVPYALFGLPVGALIDRYDRRALMVGADLARGLLVLLIPIAATLSLPLVYALLFALTCASMVFTPARQAAVPELVSGDELPRANTAFQAVNYVVDLLAFPLAGIVVAALVQAFGVHRGTSAVFAIDSVSYVASAVLLARLPVRGVRSAQQLRGSVLDGVRFLARNRHLRANTVLLTLGPLLLGSLHTLWIGFAWRVSDSGTVGYSTIELANALGTLLGLWLLPRLLGRLNVGRVVLVGFAVMGSAIALAGLSTSVTVVAVLAAVSGVGNVTFLVPSITLVQRMTPPALRGRVMAVRMTLTFCAFSASNALAGGLSDAMGTSTLLLLLGGGTLALAAAATVWPSAREAQ